MNISDTSHPLPPSACLSCGKSLDAATSVDAEAKPTPGSITICIGCGHLMAFAADLSLRELTDEEAVAIAGDRRIIAVQKARGKVLKR